jgi:hypothetical protein
MDDDIKALLLGLALLNVAGEAFSAPLLTRLREEIAKDSSPTCSAAPFPRSAARNYETLIDEVS